MEHFNFIISLKWNHGNNDKDDETSFWSERKWQIIGRYNYMSNTVITKR